MNSPNTSLTAICACSSESPHSNDASRYLLEKKLSEWLSNQSVKRQKSRSKHPSIQVLLGTNQSCGTNNTA
jgi:hypothetical protein